MYIYIYAYTLCLSIILCDDCTAPLRCFLQSRTGRDRRRRPPLYVYSLYLYLDQHLLWYAVAAPLRGLTPISIYQYLYQ